MGFGRRLGYQTAPDAAAVRGGCPPPSTPSPLVQATHPSLYNMASPLMQPNVSPAACTARSKPAVPYHSLKSGQHVTFDPTGHPMTQGLSPSHADKGASRRAVVHASNFDGETRIHSRFWSCLQRTWTQP